jgi:membrane protein
MAENHIPAPSRMSLPEYVWSFFRLFRLSFWRAFQHDAFAIAKASAYSSILTFFPLLMVLGSVLATSHETEGYLREISSMLGQILPSGTAAALSSLKAATHRPFGLIATTSLLTLWTASGAVISWMEAFRRAYGLPKTWGIVKERMIAFSLVILAGIPMSASTILVAFGSRIESRVIFHTDRAVGFYIVLLWTTIRWGISILTSIAVVALIYHNAVPRTQPWHSVMPGAFLATAMWYTATAFFGWYLQHYANYSLIYGSLGAGIALLVWMYLVSLFILVGAEFNALLFPRAFPGRELMKAGGKIAQAN